MDGPDFDKRAKTLYPLLTDLFAIATTYRREDKLVISLAYRYDRERSAKILEDRLKLAGYDFSLRDTEDVLILDIDPKRRIRIPRINIVLFFLTLLTVYIIPVLFKHLDLGNLAQSIEDTVADLGRGTGLMFTVAMISILFVHEMGHFIASRRRGIITSWPYFIPAPNIIGTFGAVIKSRSPFWNRRDLVEVGSAGPIAGWIVALGWLVYGLTQSTIVGAGEVVTTGTAFFLEGESLLMRSLLPAIVGVTPPGHAYLLNEAAFAGWVGLLVTAINLLPIGQLDGGHIIYGLARRWQRKLGLLAMGALFILGFDSPMWWFFAAFGLVFGVSHPPTMNDNIKLSRAAFVMGVVSLIILVLSFTPVPFRWQ